MIPDDVLAAYRETHYHVYTAAPFTLRVGERSEELATLHRDFGVAASAFISACNPYSSQLGEDDNRQRHVDFGRELAVSSITAIEGLGQHSTNEWPGEPSYLLLGVALETAQAMGVRLEQNAILWMDEDATPRLVLLR
jgi:hypothetical protein